MKNTLVLFFAALLLMVVAVPGEARVGGGRSSGSRGSRGMAAPRNYQQPNQGYSAQQPYRAAPASPYGQPQSSGGGWMRSLGAGLAGGFLGSMLFGGISRAGGMGGMGGGGGIGFIEILLLAGIAYLVYRMVKGRRMATAGGPNATQYSGFENDPRYRDVSASVPQPLSSGEAPEDILSRLEPGFDARKFRDQRMDDFFQLQAAWANGDLSSIRTRLSEEMAENLGRDLADLRAAGRLNKLDNIAVREVELVEAWEDNGRAYATVRLRANLVDYTVNTSTGEVVAGSKTEPVKFNELWTFVKEIGFGARNPQWRLSAIEQESGGE